MATINLPSGHVVLVDDDWCEMLREVPWQFNQGKDSARVTSMTSARLGPQRQEPIHRVIMDAPKGRYVDHINGDVLDNRRVNLRLCSNAENSRNCKKSKAGTNKYKGASWHKKDRVWNAYIMKDRKQIRLGRFQNEVDAARAYNEAAIRLFGEYARLNVIEGE